MAAPLAAAALSALLLAGCAANLQEAPPSIEHSLLHQRVAWELDRSDGQKSALPAQDAKATLIEFWVTYCKGCGRSLPRTQAMTASLRERGVQVELVAVLYDNDDLDRVRQVVEGWGVTSPYLLDRGGRVWRQFHIPVPGFVVLDRQGVVQWVAPQSANEKQAAQAALKIAEEAR